MFKGLTGHMLLASMSLDLDGGKLRAARRAAGLDQSRLAELVGVVGPARVSNWETGRAMPHPSQLAALSRELNVPIYDLLVEVPCDQRDLRRLRLEAGLTIEELSDRVGIAVPTWARWERGQVAGLAKRVPLDIVATALRVDEKSLLIAIAASVTHQR